MASGWMIRPCAVASWRRVLITEVGAVSSPTLSYVTVEYDARTRMLTYTDDVSPLRVPNQARFAVYLALAARLAALNARVNAA